MDTAAFAAATQWAIALSTTEPVDTFVGDLTDGLTVFATLNATESTDTIAADIVAVAPNFLVYLNATETIDTAQCKVFAAIFNTGDEEVILHPAEIKDLHVYAENPYMFVLEESRYMAVPGTATYMAQPRRRAI